MKKLKNPEKELILDKAKISSYYLKVNISIEKMLKRKLKREKGKVRLSEYFKKLNKGDRVAIVREHSENPKFPKRIQGRTGVIEGIRGSSYVVKVKELNQEKIHIIKPIHLKRIK